MAAKAEVVEIAATGPCAVPDGSRADRDRPFVAGAALTFPAFRSRAPWWGRDLQTLRSAILSHAAHRPVPDGERVAFPVADGSGDVLLGTLHNPATAAP